MIPKLQPITQRVQLPEACPLTDMEQFVHDWVADPEGELCSIFQQCRDTPTDLCEIGRVVFGIYASFDQKRIAHEEGV